MLAAALPTPAGDRLSALSGGRPPPAVPPSPCPGGGRGSVGQGGGRRGSGRAGGRAPRPCHDTPTFLPEERRRPEGAVRAGGTPERYRREIFFPFDTSDFFTRFFFLPLFI